MTAVRQQVRLVMAVMAVAFGLSLPASGQHAPLAMFDRIERGRWELRTREAGGSIQTLCVADTRRLVQLRHPQNQCERFVVDDQPDDVTVQYTCRGRGYGRTHIRRESARLVQIETQGIADGLPFNFVAEGRRVGDCAG